MVYPVRSPNSPNYQTSHAALIVIPQDPLLFSGTVRSNLDPFGVHQDATLYSALRATCLVDRADAEEETVVSSDSREITLDTVVEEEGLNLSLGQVRPSLAMRFNVDLTTIESCSDVLSGWLVPWSRTLKLLFWMRQPVCLSFILHDPFTGRWIL